MKKKLKYYVNKACYERYGKELRAIVEKMNYTVSIDSPAESCKKEAQKIVEFENIYDLPNNSLSISIKAKKCV